MISIAALICAADLQKLLVASLRRRALFATHIDHSNVRALFGVLRTPRVTQMSFNVSTSIKIILGG
jgi:hypothetical protein